MGHEAKVNADRRADGALTMAPKPAGQPGLGERVTKLEADCASLANYYGGTVRHQGNIIAALQGRVAQLEALTITQQAELASAAQALADHTAAIKVTTDSLTNLNALGVTAGMNIGVNALDICNIGDRAHAFYRMGLLARLLWLLRGYRG